MTGPLDNSENFASDSAKTEWLSAWLDDELSLDERAEFEQLLNSSPELQAELNELQQISDSVRSLPKTSAPDELRATVMQVVERDTLLGSGETAAKKTISKQAVAIAALVIVGVVAFWMTRGDDQYQVAQKNDSQPIKSTSQPMGPRHANKPSHSAPQQTQTTQQGETIEAEGFRIVKGDLTEARVGDVVEAMVRRGDSVSVVSLTVVDRRKGLEALEIVLANSNDSVDESAATKDQLVGVYIESGAEELSKAFSEISEYPGFEELEFSSTIKLSELDPEFVAAFKESQESTSVSRLNVHPGSNLATIADGASIKSAKLKHPTDTVKGHIRVIFLVADPQTNKSKS